MLSLNRNQSDSSSVQRKANLTENQKIDCLKNDDSTNKTLIFAFGGYVLLGLLCTLLATIGSFQLAGQSRWLFLSLLTMFFVNSCLGSYLLFANVANQPMHSTKILSAFHILLNSLLIGFWLFCQSFNGSCSINGLRFIEGVWDCNPEYNSNGLPFDTLIFAMMTPLVYAYIFADVSWIVSLVSWMIIVAWISVCIGYFNAYNTINGLIIYVAFSIIVLEFTYENQKKIAALNMKINECEIEMQRIDDKSGQDAKEIQSRLGNVAHDLKTPASITISGVDNIEIAVKECLIALEIGQLDLITFSSAMKTISEAATHIKTVSKFMLGTVNRFLDYSKSQEGVKLTAKYDTICFEDALALPKLFNQTLNSETMNIEFLPVLGESICTHIITDNAWLQENLMCLLSNAAKYSDEGTITVSISLVDVSDLPEHHHTNVDSNGNKPPDTAITSAASAAAGVKDNNYFKCNSSDHGESKDKDIESQDTVSVSKEINWSKFVRRSKVGIDPTDVAKNQDVLGSSASVNNQQMNAFGIVPAEASSATLGPAVIRNLLTNQKRSLSKSSIVTTPKRLSARSDNSFKLSESTQMLLFEVEDHGIGISEEKMKDLFSPFQQAQRHAGGTGLGLFSLGNRIDALNGRYGVHARNDKTQGTVFWFAIAYKPDKTAAKHALKLLRKQMIPKLKPVIIIEALVPEVADLQAIVPTLIKGILPTVIGKSILCVAPQVVVIIPVPANTSDKRVTADDVSLIAASEMPYNGVAHILTAKSLVLQSLTDDNNNDDDESSYSAVTPALGGINNLHYTFPYKLHILLVDDSVSVLKMVGNVLTKSGHTVVEAANGANALKKLEALRMTPGMKTFDLVIIDLQMPVMDGIEFTKRLRKIEADLNNVNPSLNLKIHQKVILCSANGDGDETLALAEEAGIDGTLEKPLELEKLYQLYLDIEAAVSRG